MQLTQLSPQVLNSLRGDSLQFGCIQVAHPLGISIFQVDILEEVYKLKCILFSDSGFKMTIDELVSIDDECSKLHF
jgi:hypothetical protein